MLVNSDSWELTDDHICTITQYLANLSLSFDPPPSSSSSHLRSQNEKKHMLLNTVIRHRVEPLSHTSWLTWTICLRRRRPHSPSWKPGRFTLVSNIAQLQRRQSNIPASLHPLERQNKQSESNQPQTLNKQAHYCWPKPECHSCEFASGKLLLAKPRSALWSRMVYIRAARYIACDTHAHLVSKDGSVISRKSTSPVFKWSGI